MRKANIGALLALGGTLALILGLAGPAQSQRAPEKKQTLPERLTTATKLPRENVDKFLSALGPAISAHLAGGEPVQVPGLGLFRVVSVPEHRDLVDGRPAVIPAANYVEFVPSVAISATANTPGIVPSIIVPPFRYNTLPGQTPSDRVGGTRQPTTRQP
jgi:nucleoid DNA-binding protein